MKIFNSLTRKIEEFVPINPLGKKVSIYTCGPTVYFYPHIGNWRTFLLGDLAVRTLEMLGYQVSYVMNITDVGHLTGDNLGDSSQGEDRLEKGAKREGKNAWDVAKFYENDFIKGYEKLDLSMPTIGKFCRATDHIKEQIEMISAIEKKGFTYNISDGVYFDVGRYEKAGFSYGLMSNIHKDNVEARVEPNLEKKDSRDFALWKFSPIGEKRQMEWESPWGIGFPGWHIECSAMSTKYLGEQIDIHIGGEDHKSTHHPNEIAQSEAATGKIPFVKYWIHGAFLQVDGGRMGKSLGNAYTLHDIEDRGFDAMDLKYFYMTGHYSKPLNFTFESLKSAALSLNGLRIKVARLTKESGLKVELDVDNDYYKKFINALGDDLNTPRAMAVLWELIGDEVLESNQKLALIAKFDEIFNLSLLKNTIEEKIPEDILKMVKERDVFRSKMNWEEADEIRVSLEKFGYKVEDTPKGGMAIKIKGKREE